MNFNSLKKHILNVHGKRLQGKYFVIESDDWGAIRIPNIKVREQLIRDNCLSKFNPFSITDTLESVQDLDFLQKSLKQVRDCDGNHPIITANFVMGNPDFDKIKSDKYESLFLETAIQSYQRYFPSERVFDLIKELISHKIIHPQFHAREHLNANQWLTELKNSNYPFVEGFKHQVYSVDASPKNGRRANVQATYDLQHPTDILQIRNSINQGLTMFEQTFGFKSRTTIAPCYVWNEDVEAIFQSHGIVGVQSSKFQNKPIIGRNSYKKVWHYHGESNKFNQKYWIRNVLFEPAVNSQVDWVRAAKESIMIAFKHQKPAVLGMHRINFVNGLTPGNREKSLSMLTEVISWAMATYPDLKFISSEQLADLYQNKNSDF